MLLRQCKGHFRIASDVLNGRVSIRWKEPTLYISAFRIWLLRRSNSCSQRKDKVYSHGLDIPGLVLSLNDRRLKDRVPPIIGDPVPKIYNPLPNSKFTVNEEFIQSKQKVEWNSNFEFAWSQRVETPKIRICEYVNEPESMFLARGILHNTWQHSNSKHSKQLLSLPAQSRPDSKKSIYTAIDCKCVMCHDAATLWTDIWPVTLSEERYASMPGSLQFFSVLVRTRASIAAHLAIWVHIACGVYDEVVS
jgi:hypothetical protein